MADRNPRNKKSKSKQNSVHSDATAESEHSSNQVLPEGHGIETEVTFAPAQNSVSNCAVNNPRLSEEPPSAVPIIDPNSASQSTRQPSHGHHEEEERKLWKVSELHRALPRCLRLNERCTYF